MENIKYAPVVITTCNRYKHLRDCIESLAACTYAEETELYISVDYPPNENYIQGWKKVKEYVQNIRGFKKVHILLQESNLGAGANSFFVMDKAFEKCECLIFTEDDNVFALAFLDYMNKMLRQFEKDPKVYSIAGFSMLNPQYSSKIYKSHTYIPWGIGIWKNKWYSLCNLKQTQVYEVYARKPFKIASLYFKNKWLFCVYVSHLIGEIHDPYMPDSIQSLLYHLLGYCTIVPTKSLAKNKGLDGTGNACEKDAIPNIDAIQLYEEPVFHYDRSTRIPVSKKLQFPTPEWVKKSSKFGQDPLTYILYYIMGKERYKEWREKKGI